MCVVVFLIRLDSSNIARHLFVTQGILGGGCEGLYASGRLCKQMAKLWVMGRERGCSTPATQLSIHASDSSRNFGDAPKNKFSFRGRNNWLPWTHLPKRHGPECFRPIKRRRGQRQWARDSFTWTIAGRKGFSARRTRRRSTDTKLVNPLLNFSTRLWECIRISSHLDCLLRSCESADLEDGGWRRRRGGNEDFSTGAVRGCICWKILPKAAVAAYIFPLRGCRARIDKRHNPLRASSERKRTHFIGAEPCHAGRPGLRQEVFSQSPTFNSLLRWVDIDCRFLVVFETLHNIYSALVSVCTKKLDLLSSLVADPCKGRSI